ncbi:double-strand break repair helicase AddA [Polymorphobacter glacialis]|uniref:DNA 3'-5' helicase n=1 Tax=Sandarakinorhabdus glacialis TaxID=1614636 RepID=A0A917E6X4_9SPHN|nr:double-strand break repair helicase AddA [Polymorphobacter glacialis]GGE10687.1 double-strand break repair helicase AddA [Polymorphobacter glacialis]
MIAGKRLLPLMDAQASAAAPDVHAWVAASAGTGKTQVLSARVLRLLLQGTPPHAILCLTFTKLAAAEMQTRVFDRLASWARCSDEALAADLTALRAGDDAEMGGRARRLFAQVLDAPQGLAVQTIHAFAQGLIASFPVEAGVAPGFATLDDRGGAVLRRRLLAEAIERADAEGDGGFLGDLAAISIAGGEMQLGSVAQRLGGHAEALAGLRLEGIEPMLRRGFGLASDSDAAGAAKTGLARIDRGGLQRLAAALAAAGNDNAVKLAAGLTDWLGTAEPGVEAIYKLFVTADDTPRKTMVPKAADLRDPSLKDLCAQTGLMLIELAAEQRLYAVAAHAACHLRVGKRLAADWALAKARLGVVDYDDMIAAAERLLLAPGAAEWVRYKLDQRIDHVLVDEAQDTNGRQWRIVEALSSEFFDGEGARDVQRTLFVVGDYKQAIFSFQGSDPKIYRDKREHFEALASDSRELWRNIDLATNFRSVPAVLEVVDAVADVLGHPALDPLGHVPRHQAHRAEGAGYVTLWPPMETDAGGGDDDGGGDSESDDDSEGVRAPKAEIALAHQIAERIAGWLDPRKPMILPARGVPVRPQDILVLVRSRSAFSGALVAALHVHGVPVAGVDRLKLTEPLAVADMLALARFALQPADDLTLAALLVSPFINLDHERLFALADEREGNLWQRVRDSGDPLVLAAREWLTEMLGFADFAAPYEFFERVLSGKLQGRAKLLARLGEEARDAIDAVLDQALAFEAANAPSLQGFLAWVEGDDIEIKRDPDAPLDAVRLMTVHGAKGLQAPVVIMADATKARRAEREAPVMMAFDGGPPLPVFVGSRKALGGRLGDAIQQADEDAEREHCRLLYVALTRAEDLLFIGGALGPGKTEAPEGSWYAIVKSAMEGLDIETDDEGAMCFATGVPMERKPVEAVIRPEAAVTLPAWAREMPAEEARPPRPLSPSAIAADDVAAPPASAASKLAARRGSALHALFERLPDIDPTRRREVGEAWCRMSVPDLDAGAITATVLGILDDPRFAAVFAPGALVEAPVAAVVEGIVIAGKVDRLLVAAAEVLVVDFKTGRRVPADADAVEPYHLKQMAAYVAALAKVFPDRPVRAALLYTEGPAIIDLPDALLALHVPQAELSLKLRADTPISPA